MTTVSFDRDVRASDVIDFLEKGLLESLVLLFKADPVLYPLLTELLVDERLAVRLGTSALVESLAEEDPEMAGRAVDALLPLLSHGSPTVRGDAAYLLGSIGRVDACEYLHRLAGDEDGEVREAASEALEKIGGQGPPI